MIKLICPKCGNKVNPNTKRPRCGKCYTRLPKSTQTCPSSISAVAENVLSGNIIEAIKKTGIDPKKKRGDIIPLVLQDSELEICLAKASREAHETPEKIMRVALREWLIKRGYNLRRQKL